MKNEALLKVAREHQSQNGTVTVWILPFRPIWLNVPEKTLQDSIGDDATSNRAVFCRFDAYLLDVKTTNGAPVYWQLAAQYFKERTGDIVKDWELFQTLGSVDVLDDFIDIYEDTRQTALSAPADIQREVEKDDSDPEA